MAGKLTSAQIAEYRDAFNLYDADGSGSIDLKELGTVMRSLGGVPSDAELRMIMHEVDKDKSGTIDFGEFCDFMKANAHRNNNPEEELKEAFAVFDKDKSGSISKRELSEVLTSIGEVLTSDELDRFIKIADKDGDGEISYKEFVKIFTEKVLQATIPTVRFPLDFSTAENYVESEPAAVNLAVIDTYENLVTFVSYTGGVVNGAFNTDNSNCLFATHSAWQPASLPLAITGPSSWTICLWLRRNDNSNARGIFSMYNIVDNSGLELHTNNNRLQLRYHVVGNQYDSATTTFSLVENEWHLICLAYNNTERTFDIHVQRSPTNRDLLRVNLNFPFLPAQGPAPMLFGAQSDGGANPKNIINAFIDDIRFFDFALSTAEVDYLFDNPQVPFVPTVAPTIAPTPSPSIATTTTTAATTPSISTSTNATVASSSTANSTTTTTVAPSATHSSSGTTAASTAVLIPAVPTNEGSNNLFSFVFIAIIVGSVVVVIVLVSAVILWWRRRRKGAARRPRSGSMATSATSARSRRVATSASSRSIRRGGLSRSRHSNEYGSLTPRSDIPQGNTAATSAYTRGNVGQHGNSGDATLAQYDNITLKPVRQYQNQSDLPYARYHFD